MPQLLTDPFLQLPTDRSVHVVWFTEFAGSQHRVTYGTNLEQTAIATTTKLSRVYEDQDSKTPWKHNQPLTQEPVFRDIWRHEAEVTGLTPGERIPYCVTSVLEDGQEITSEVFTLAANPLPNQALNILLTSDHQLKPMVSANLQKVIETIGQVDGVFFVGDLIDVPDRASDWFDNSRGNAFFPSLQGRGAYTLAKEGTETLYTGGRLIQHAPLFTAIGNHEVMGRSTNRSLDEQFNDAVPYSVAQRRYTQQASTLNPDNDPQIQATWIKDNSFNTDTYEEIFTLPQSPTGGKRYYAVTFGNVRLISLYATGMWRSPALTPDTKGRYREREQDFNDAENWGYGQHLFGAIAKGSPQYNWLEQELQSPEFQQVKYKVVMLHHPPHSLGDNIVPAYTDPIQVITQDAKQQIQSIRYEYPREQDYLIRDVMPLLEAAGVHLVFFGHSHLWNRFVSEQGMHFLESSNVGNSYGAFLGDHQRPVPAGYTKDYVAAGDPNGLDPIVPAIAPLRDPSGQPLPYIASNDITAFSILEAATGTVSSYYFDTRKPNSAVIKFDEFRLG